VLLRVAAAVILLQTLFFKFTGAAESVYIFSTLGAEPWGRLGSGALELAASILLLWPATSAVGALLGLGLMSGAIVSHVAVLGIEIMDDGGVLFALAVVVFAACAGVLWIERARLPLAGTRGDFARGAR
jgi:hypothetical protein